MRQIVQNGKGAIPFAVMAFMAFIAACSDDDVAFCPPGSTGEILFEPTISQTNLTRASDAGFADGDRMGVYIVDYQGSQPGTLVLNNNRASNLMMTFEATSGRCNPSTPVYWKDGQTPVDVYSYYPYTSGINSIEEFQFTVSANQREMPEEGMGEYEKSDFLWAKKSGAQPAGGAIQLTYRHRLSGVRVTLTQGTGFSDMEWEKLPRTVTVDHTLRNATINLATGEATATGTFDRHITMAEEGTDTYRAVVVPQTVEAGKSVISVTLDGIAYHLTQETAMTYQPGKLHKFTIQVNRREGGDCTLALVGQEITAWENDELSHAFQAIAYTVIHCPTEGTLKQCVEAAGKKAADIQHLKVIGRMNEEDFKFIREEIPMLKALNIYEVTAIGEMPWYSGDNERGKIYRTLMEKYGRGNELKENILPTDALNYMTELSHLVLPQHLEMIGGYALNHIGLGSNSTLVIPSSVRVLGNMCMMGISQGNLILPDSLEIIDDFALDNNECTFEYNLGNTVRWIGDGAFSYGNGARSHCTGTFKLPDNLLYLGEYAFSCFGENLTGEIKIPEQITQIPRNAFEGIHFANGTTLLFHDRITHIDKDAFEGGKYNNRIVWPHSLVSIERSSFEGCTFNGGIDDFPEGLTFIGERAFANTKQLSGRITLPKSLECIATGSFSRTFLTDVTVSTDASSIAYEAFAYCDYLQSVRIDRFVEEIGDHAFYGCLALKTVQCLAPIPPNISSEDGKFPFEWCDYEHLVLEVPEQSVSLYRHAPGWNKLKYITAYHELAVSVSRISCLDKGIRRDAVVRSEGAWTVSECPSWCHVSPASGSDRATEITITVDPSTTPSSGQIVFRLDGKDYSTTCEVSQMIADHPEDSEIVLQEAKAGFHPIPIFIVGDGFTAKEVADGTYLETMKQQMEYFFSIEPYKTYRDYFSVSTALAVSPGQGISNVEYLSDTRFQTVNDLNTGFRCDYDRLREYVVSTASGINDFNIDKTLVMLIVNQQTFDGNAPSIYEDIGYNLSITTLSPDDYPYDTRGLVQHYAGGKAFGLQAEEYISHLDFLQGCTCPGCRCMKEYNVLKSIGGCQNISLSGSFSAVPWAHLIFDTRYSDLVDVYEGGYRHLRGVFRSEPQSCMGTYIPYYSTISREAIVRRIMEFAGTTFNFEDFVAKDSREGCPQP